MYHWMDLKGVREMSRIAKAQWHGSVLWTHSFAASTHVAGADGSHWPLPARRQDKIGRQLQGPEPCPKPAKGEQTYPVE
jgi:hypothetical protein